MKSMRYLVYTCVILTHNLSAMAAPKKNVVDTETFYSTVDKSQAQDALQKASKLREETIASINVLLKEKTLSNTQRIELYIRLGELYTEQHDYLRHQELQNFEDDYDRWLAQKSTSPEPQPNFTASLSQLTKAAITYKELLGLFPNSPRHMQVTFTLAKTLARLGRDEAVQYFEKFIAKYPNTPLVVDAHLALGEFYFAKGKITLALPAYQKATADAQHPAYSYAMFKLGWCFYNKAPDADEQLEKNLREALRAFQTVVKVATSAAAQKKVVLVSLREESIQDLIMVYADLGDVDGAWQYFKDLGEPAAFYQMLERLAFMLDEKGKNAEAAPLYERLLKEMPTGKNNPNVHLQLSQLYAKSLDFPRMLATFATLASNYTDKSAWLTAQGTPDEQATILKTTQDKIASYLHRQGTVYHDMGLKAKNKQYLQVAADIYTLFLKHFPTSALQNELRYYLADIQYELGDLLASADNFFVVAQSTEKKNKWRKDASLNAIYALNDHRQKLGKDYLPILPKLTATHWHFLKTFPQEKETLSVKANLTAIYTERKDFAQANPLAKEIIRDYPASKEAVTALTQLFTNLLNEQDWQGIDALLLIFAEQKIDKHPNLSATLTQITKQVLIQRALTHERAELYAQAAQQYLRLYEQFKNQNNVSDEQEKFLYNAIANYYKAGQVEYAIQEATKFSKLFPKSPLAKDVLLDLASAHETLTQFAKAADYHYEFARRFPRNTKAPTTMYNAVVIYKNLKNDAAFENIANQMLQLYPSHTLSTEVYWSLTDHYEQKGKFEAASKILNLLAKHDNLLLPADKLYLQGRLLHLDFLIDPDANSLANNLNAFRKDLLKPENAPAERARCSLAKTMFSLAEPKFMKFIDFKLNDRKNIEGLAKRKQNNLVQIAGDYRTVVALNCAEFVVASFYRLGEMHENFASDLLSAETPENLTDSAALEYKTEIEKVASPLKEEAYQFFSSAFKAGQDAKAFSPWTQKSFAKMQVLEPSKHPPIFELSPKPKYYSQKLEARYVQ